MKEMIETHLSGSINVKKELAAQQLPTIEEAGLALANVYAEQGKVLLCGNGGSAADAQHIAAELVVRYKGGNERRALPAQTLSPDPSTITACGNDYGYDQLFARSVDAFGNQGDALIAISTSGNSKNVLEAIKAAKAKEMKVITLLGGDGGQMKGMADIEIIVPSTITAHIQEAHITIGHILCAIIEKKCFNLD